MPRVRERGAAPRLPSRNLAHDLARGRRRLLVVVVVPLLAEATVVVVME